MVDRPMNPSAAGVDVRWFRQNDYELLVVPRLQQMGLVIATSGDAPVKVVVTMNHDLAGAAWRWARRRGTPLVTYVWDLPPFRLGAGGPDHIVSIRGRLLRVPRVGHRYTTRRGYYSRLRFVARHAAAVWTPSRASAADINQRFGVEAEVVPYCFNSDLFNPTVRDTPRRGSAQGDRLSLLSISRLTVPKNHEAVVRAAARLGATVEIIGRGPTQPTLEALADRLHVPVRIRAGLTGSEVVASYRAASVVVCPSRFEGLGLTGIEGAICGVPVVASDIPAHREFLGSTAQFFTLDDDDSLVTAIERARVADPPSLAPFAQLTIEAAAQRFADRLRRYL